MVLAFDMSAALGLCPAADARRVRAHLEAVGLPVSPLTIAGANVRGWDAARLVEHMRADKKNRDGKLTFILARGIGQSFVRRGVDGAAALDTMRRALAA
jgi:3-dehydroquinate synthase